MPPADTPAAATPARPSASTPPRGQRSLFGEILDWMLAPLLLLWPMSVTLTWLVAQDIAHQPYDRALGELAVSLAQQLRVVPGKRGQPGSGTRLALKVSPDSFELLPAEDREALAFQVLGSRGELLGGSPELHVPEDLPRPPLGELRFRDDTLAGDPVRVAYLWVEVPEAEPGRPALIQVAETLAKRSRLANEIIKGVILPQFVILPVAVLLVWFALARGIAPLHELQQRIRQRASDDLSPIAEHDAPEEVAPLVRAINDLLARLDRSLATQKRFLADAAHQLKTPLAGLRTQAELAQRDLDRGEPRPEALRAALGQIALSSQRAAHMVNQLLAMARAEGRQQRLPRDVLDLGRLAREAVHDFVPTALERRIDLGFECLDELRPPLMLGHAVLLGELLRNLVDNALRYTPAGGVVTVRVEATERGVLLVVEDSGPGIAAAERELVLQPFYRVLGSGVDGSGLGLAIVAEVARQHEATLVIDATLDHPPPGQGPGARFTLRFPAVLDGGLGPEDGPDPREVHP